MFGVKKKTNKQTKHNRSFDNPRKAETMKITDHGEINTCFSLRAKSHFMAIIEITIHEGKICSHFTSHGRQGDEESQKWLDTEYRYYIAHLAFQAHLGTQFEERD